MSYTHEDIVVKPAKRLLKALLKADKKKPKKGPKYLVKLKHIANAKLKDGVRIFQQIVKDSYNRHYGVDHNGTFWRLDRLKAQGIGYKTVGA